MRPTALPPTIYCARGEQRDVYAHAYSVSSRRLDGRSEGAFGATSSPEIKRGGRRRRKER